MTTLLTIVHIVVSLFLICIVLLQHGKGADIGATFGGSSQSLFGTEGPVPLLNKITTMAAIVFMCTSVSLAYMSAHKSTGSVMEDIEIQAPAVPVASPAQREAATIPLPDVKAGVMKEPEASPEGAVK
jgi:preprotein translocase subunit SecG